MFPTEPFVRSILRPYEATLCAVFDRAWQQVSRLPGRATFDFKRTVATLMHQFVMNEVRSEFGDNKHVRLIDGHETIRLLIERRLILRLKKMDRRGYTRAIPTQATLAFTNELPVTLPFSGQDLPDIFTIDFGYVLNELGTGIESKLVASRYGESVLWSYSPDDAADTAVVATISPAPEPPKPPSTAAIIRLPIERKDSKEDGDK